MNDCSMNTWPRGLVYFCLDKTAANQHITIHEIWPRGTLCQCVRLPGGKITSTIYAKGLFLPEGPYNFNILVALFSKTNA